MQQTDREVVPKRIEWKDSKHRGKASVRMDSLPLFPHQKQGSDALKFVVFMVKN